MPKKTKVKKDKNNPTTSMATRRRRAATRIVQVSRRASTRARSSRFNLQRLVPAPVKRGLTGIGAYDVTQRIAARLGVQGTGSRIAGMALGFSTGGIEGTVAAVAVDTMDQGFIASSFAQTPNGNGLTPSGGAEAV